MLKKLFNACAALAAIFFITATIAQESAYARAGGGRSFGGGSRSYSRPYAPSRQGNYTQPYSTQPGGGFLRSLGGAMAGGFLGSMLFRGMGYGSTGWGGGGGGLGLLEILIIGGIGLMIYRRYQRNKNGSKSPFQVNRGLFGGDTDNSDSRESDISDIKSSDPSFDEIRFKDNVMDMFFKIQAAWMNRDLSSVKSLLTEEMKNNFQEDIDELLRSKKINRLENIAVRNVEISEAWQESEQDYITTLIYANILDYTIDDQNGNILSGSKTDPVKFEEYWTFTRPSRSKQWKLSTINQV